MINFCSKALHSSRAFIRRFDDVLTSVKVMKSYYKVGVTNEMEIDAMMWPEYLIISMGPNIYAFVCLMELNATFNIVEVSYWWRKLEDPEKTTDLPQVTLSHNVVHLTLIEIRTDNISGDRH